MLKKIPFLQAVHFSINIRPRESISLQLSLLKSYPIMMKFDGVNVLSDRPVREHYISFGEKDVLSQLVDKVGEKPEIVKVPINEIKALSAD